LREPSAPRVDRRRGVRTAREAQRHAGVRARADGLAAQILNGVVERTGVGGHGGERDEMRSYAVLYGQARITYIDASQGTTVIQ